MLSSVEPGGFQALTLDCYGTIVDWRRGVAAAASRVPALEGCDLERIVRDREAIERELETGPYRPYGAILAESLRRAALLQDRLVGEAQGREFAAAMGDWPPFPDSRAALRRLRSRYRLAILSNVETRVLRRSLRRVGVAFEARITAEDVRSYKPGRAHFDAALERLRLPKERILHVAVSLFHDIRPAQALGWPTAWVDREGEALPADVRPDLIAPDLAGLAERLGC